MFAMYSVTINGHDSLYEISIRLMGFLFIIASYILLLKIDIGNIWVFNNTH